MSTRVALAFRESPHRQLRQHGIEARVIRLAVDFAGWDGAQWLRYHDAWIDTGAPLTLLPEPTWRNLQVAVLAHGLSVPIFGKTIPADLGELYVAVTDDTAFSPALRIRAYLCHSDELPILLGMDGVLTRSVLHCNHARRGAYLDFADEPSA